nr:MAG TPA: protein of unknown function (DUF5338) [Caudoviricetes sp.]
MNRNAKPPTYADLMKGNYCENGAKPIVEFLGVQEVIARLRKQGYSYRDISKYISENQLSPNGYKIGHNSIARWCRENGLGGDASIEPEENKVINIYRQNCQSLDLVNNAIDMLNVQIDDLNKSLEEGTADPKVFKSLVDSLDRLLVRQQALSATISQMQERVYKYETMNRALRLTLDIVSTKVDIDTFRAVKDALRENEILVEILREIRGSGV